MVSSAEVDRASVCVERAAWPVIPAAIEIEGGPVSRVHCSARLVDESGIDVGKRVGTVVGEVPLIDELAVSVSVED